MTPIRLFESVVAVGGGVFVDLLLLGVFALIVLFVLGTLRGASKPNPRG